MMNAAAQFAPEILPMCVGCHVAPVGLYQLACDLCRMKLEQAGLLKPVGAYLVDQALEADYADR